MSSSLILLCFVVALLAIFGLLSCFGGRWPKKSAKTMVTPSTGIMILERIKSATSARDLLAVIMEYPSSEFSNEENACFLQRIRQLNLSEAEIDAIEEVAITDRAKISADLRTLGDEAFRQAHSDIV
jgi:hypothetical protein